LARLRYFGPVIAFVAVTWLTGKVVFALLIALVAYVAPKVTIDPLLGVDENDWSNKRLMSCLHSARVLKVVLRLSKRWMISQPI